MPVHGHTSPIRGNFGLEPAPPIVWLVLPAPPGPPASLSALTPALPPWPPPAPGLPGIAAPPPPPALTELLAEPLLTKAL